MPQLESYAHLDKAYRAQLAVWPEHANFLQTRFADDSPEFLERTDQVAKLALVLADDRLDEFCRDYRWMCENFIEEELYFRRHKKYRLSSFADAYREVYGDPTYMSRYVKGILLSQLFWHNHAAAMDLFRTSYLPSLPRAFDHLEVGPGHGLFFAQAATHPNCGSASGWDVSPSSIAATREALHKFGIVERVKLIEQDVLIAPKEGALFDSAIISEVLEHLERPDLALNTLFQSLRPGGRLFVNMPINSPAPDHIYFCSSIKQVSDLVEKEGFLVDEVHKLPITGYSLERALRKNIGISCVVLATKP